ncbi:MAG: hypothetical protein VX589_10040 [Myxococcota bacterium]|nr:hypothetical protein [Myxococcota bacterium]
MHTLSLTIGDTEIFLEAGQLARNASGSVVVRHEKTMVLAAVTIDWDNPDDEQFPLLVDYRERMAAAGRIPGNFFRREMRPTDGETLTCRLIDRAIRPLFPSGFNYPTTVSITVFSADQRSDLAGLGMLAASSAIGLSELPFAGPVIGGTVARDGDRLTFQASPAEAATSDFDMVLALGPDGLLMLEGGGAPVSNADILAMIEVAQLVFGGALEALPAFIRQHGA